MRVGGMDCRHRVSTGVQKKFHRELRQSSPWHLSKRPVCRRKFASELGVPIVDEAAFLAMLKETAAPETNDGEDVEAPVSATSGAATERSLDTE